MSVEAADLEGVLLLDLGSGWHCLFQEKASLSLGAVATMLGTQ